MENVGIQEISWIVFVVDKVMDRLFNSLPGAVSSSERWF